MAGGLCGDFAVDGQIAGDVVPTSYLVRGHLTLGAPHDGTGGEIRLEVPFAR